MKWKWKIEAKKRKGTSLDLDTVAFTESFIFEEFDADPEYRDPSFRNDRERSLKGVWRIGNGV